MARKTDWRPLDELEEISGLYRMAVQAAINDVGSGTAVHQLTDQDVLAAVKMWAEVVRQALPYCHPKADQALLDEIEELKTLVRGPNVVPLRKG